MGYAKETVPASGHYHSQELEGRWVGGGGWAAWVAEM